MRRALVRGAWLACLVAAPALAAMAAGSPDAAPAPRLVGRDLSAGVSAPLLGLGTPRSLAQRAADVRDIRDYGADGRGTPIGAAYGRSLAAALGYVSPGGQHPLAHLADPMWGLQVRMPLSAAIAPGGTSGAFTGVNTIIGGLTRSFATWNLPQNGNMHIVPGMIVTAPGSGTGAGCLPAAGVAVAAVPNLSFAASAPVAALIVDQHGAPVANTAATTTDTEYEPSGAVELAAASAPGCPVGTELTFTVSPRQFMALTRDFVAFVAAEMDIVASGAGGTVYVPAPGMAKNWPLVLPMPGGAGGVPQISVRGDPGWASSIVDTADLGALSCSMVEADRSSAGGAHTRVTDISFQGPARRGAWGAPVGLMNGICIGSGTRLDHVNARGYHAGVWITQDHGVLDYVYAHDDFYGLWFGPEVVDLGNWKIENSSFTGNGWAAVAVAAENTPNESIWVNDYCGLTPYCWYGELPSPRLRVPAAVGLQGLLLGVKCDGCGFEQVGDGIVYQEAKASGFTNLVFDNSPAFACDPGFQVPGRGCPYYFWSNGMNSGARFVNNSEISGITPPGISYVAARNYEGDIFFDEADSLIGQTGRRTVRGATRDVYAVSGMAADITFRLRNGGTGRFRSVEGGVTMNQGEIAGFGPDVSSDDSMKPLRAGHPAAGVLLQAAINDAYAAVQDTGDVGVDLSPGGSATITQYLCADPAHPGGATDCPVPATAADIRLGVEVGPKQGVTSAAPGASPERVSVHLRMN